MTTLRAKLAVGWAILLWMLVLPIAPVEFAFARGGRGGGGRGGGRSAGRNSGGSGASSARGSNRGGTRGSKDKDLKRNRERDGRELRDALKRAAADDAV